MFTVHNEYQDRQRDKFRTIRSCNGPLGVFRGMYPEIKVKSWSIDPKNPKRTIINDDENLSVTEISFQYSD